MLHRKGGSILYIFKEVNASFVDQFNQSVEKGHILQTSYWAKLKKEWQPVFLAGFDEEDTLVLTATLHLRKLPYVGIKMGYIPRGFVCDFKNKELLKEFTDYLKEYAKKNKIGFITIDPDIHLRENEELIPKAQEIKDYLKGLGFENSDSKNFEGIQPNFVFRNHLPIEGDKEEIKQKVFKSFSRKTRYNIKVAEERGLTVEVYDKENITDEVLSRFHEIMVTTGKRDNFIVRQKEYFANMMEYLYPYCRLYMVKYSFQKDFGRLNEKLKQQEAERIKVVDKLEIQSSIVVREEDVNKKSRIEKKIEELEKRLADIDRQIEGFGQKMESIQMFKNQEIYLSGSVYLYYGNKAWYLYGASENILRDAMPNFAMQWAMIEDSIDLGASTYDFRGVSGDLNTDNPLYGLYKFKKGFNGDFVEFIGSFDLVNNAFCYHLYKKAFPKFKEIRNKWMNRK